MSNHIEVIAERVSAPEGPTVGPGGWILNVCSFGRADIPEVAGGDIVATHPAHPGQTRRLFNTSAEGIVGIPAALAFGPDRALYITDEGHRAVLRATNDGAVAVHVRSPNGPNDLSFDSQGNLWFTDPWKSTLDHRVGGVYVKRQGVDSIQMVASELAFPNGIVATETYLIYAETLTSRLWRHERFADGGLGDAELFSVLPHQAGVAVQGPDGMALDAEGYLYVAHYGGGCIRVVDPEGTPVSAIATPGRNPTNLCFGDPDRKTLFVTVDDTDELLAISMPSSGQAIEFCPSTTAAEEYAVWLDLIEHSPLL